MKSIHSILVIVVLSIAIPAVLAQNVANNGTPTFNSFGGGPDVINEGTFNIHYTVPAFSRAGVGMSFSQSLPVDNGVWYKYLDIYNNYHWGFDPSTAQPAGVMAIGAVFYTIHQYMCVLTGDKYTVNAYSTTSYTGPDNTSHGVFARVYDDSCNGHYTDTPTGIATDGSGISVKISYRLGGINATVTLANGTVIIPPTIDPSGNVWGSGNYTITDANSNKITVSAAVNSKQINYILDTLGTEPITSSGGPPPTAVTYKYYAPSGTNVPVTVTYKSVTIQSAWGCTGIAEYPPTSKTLIDKITLADGTYYQFFYEATPNGSGYSTGRISSVSLPTGGSISYTYTGGDTGKGIFCIDGSTAGFNRVSAQSGEVQYSRTLSYAPNNPDLVVSSTTTIVDNDGNTTLITFGQGFEQQRSVYEGAASGTPLETVVTCYNGTDPIDPNSCAIPAWEMPQPFTRVTTFRSLNGGPYARNDTFYNSYGLVTKKDVYDWGASSYTQETQTAYDTTLGSGIVDHPSTVKVTDGAGNLKSEAAYSYDDFSISGDTKTCAPATKCRGNLTKLTRYASSSNTFTTQMTYNLNGTVATSLDPNGTTTTTFTYGSGGCGAFPTQTKVTAGSTTLTTAATYNCTGAVATSNTDANGKTTSTSYTDPYFWRPYSSTDQLGNVTTYSYTGQTIAESSMPINANSVVDVRSTLDSFGRPEYKQKRQGVGSSYFDSVQQVYDAAGRPYETSMPYQGTAGQAPGSPIYTQTSYDAMMRTTSVQDAAGGIVNTSYSENDVYQQVAPAPSGEHSKQKQLEYDGLGRLTSVCEVTTDAKYGGACGQVTGGYSGYLTKYVYDTPPNVNSLTVTQNGQPNGGTSQSRTYYYDMLGRLTYESNPETGTNQYFYDSLSGDATCGTIVSYGDLVKTIDNKGVVACLSYDGLHRVTSISYSATTPATPTKVFVYESAVVNGTTMGLTAGRLAEAYTCTTCSPTPTKLTDIGFTYSARGELLNVYESTPHSGGYYQVSANYWPHGLLSSLTLANTTLPTIYYGGSTGTGLDGEGRVTTVTASSGTSTLAKNVIYTTSGTAQPIGSLTSVTWASGDSDTFGYDPLTGRLTGYTFNMNSAVAKAGGLTWNANGSLGQLALIDDVTPSNSQTCTYSHDDLARIASASCVHGSTTLWGQTFAFDPFGNIDKTATAGTSFLPTYNLATNQYSSLTGCTPSYDGDGNLTNDCTHSYNWLADGAVASVDTVLLTYDALGRAVEQARGSSYTEIVYTPGGGKLALMSGATVQKAFIPLPGGGTAVYTTGSSVAYYRHSDWLGSSRLATTPTAPTTVYAEADYAPYGEPYDTSGTLDLNFTGQNQDIVQSQNSGLYDFLFREYNPQHGRWISPDPAGMSAVSLTSPQSWNRYAYVGNMPLTGVDPLGLLGPWGDCVGCNPWIQAGYGATYYLDGMPVAGNMALALLGMGAAVSCGNGCDPVHIQYQTQDGGIQNIGWGFQSFGADGSSNWSFSLWNMGDLQTLPNAALAEMFGLQSGSDQGQTTGPTPLPHQQQCMDANIAAVNNASSLNVSATNVVGSFPRNGAWNFDFSVASTSTSSLSAGRYPSSVFNAITGIGPSLHVPGFGGSDPSTYGMTNRSFTFTTHIDSAYATWHTPVGAFLHWFIDVRDQGAHRKPC